MDGTAVGRGRGGIQGMRGRIGEQHIGGRTGVLSGSTKIMAPLARREKAIGGSDSVANPRLWRRTATVVEEIRQSMVMEDITRCQRPWPMMGSAVKHGQRWLGHDNITHDMLHTDPYQTQDHVERERDASRPATHD